MVNQIFFIIAVLVVGVLSYKYYGRIIRNIRLGRDFPINGDVGWRIKNVLLIGLAQKKMFKNLLPAVFHLFIYVAFLITVTELIEIFADGIFGYHRFFAGYLGGFYTFVISTIEFLSVFAFVATIVFLTRRNILKIKRFNSSDLKGWPFRDANMILFGEIVLIFSIFTMNGADLILQSRLPEQYHAAGPFLISRFFEGFFSQFSTQTLVFLERTGWWMHILVVFGFLLYLPFSKHLHIIFSFINIYFTPRNPRGEMENMPVISNEVKSMLGLADASPNAAPEQIPDFGANDVTGLTWKNLLDAYSCTECGRCTAACPPNVTGKLLSPRKIVMSVRDRADELGSFLSKQRSSEASISDGKSLFDYITKEEIYACTTCNACVEACPVHINPLDVILQMRRYEILTAASGPSDWINMFTNLENHGSVWQIPEARSAWIHQE
jgi:ferredoxin